MLATASCRGFRFASALFVAVSIASGMAASGRADDPFEPVRKRIAKALVDTNVPSVAVAVVRDGQIVWEQGFGWADRENRVAASEHTLYSVASVSKPITATGLMVLKERKLIDLDKPINDYLGEAKLRARVGDANDATVRRVANHTSGLPLHYQFFYADESYRPPTREETIRRYGNLVTAPGERYQYSNLGFGVLDYVIERVGGKKFPDFMREEVFLPLGMTHTSIDVGAGLESQQAIRYTSEGQRIPFYDFDHPGASAVFTSAHDLARFAQFHMKGHLADQRAILSDGAIDEMQTATASSPGGGGYGIGWGVADGRRGHHTVEHSGGMPGVATLCSFVPGQRAAVVVLCNTNCPLVGYLADMIFKIVLAEEKAAGNKPKATGEAKGDGAFSPDSLLVGQWKGKLVTYKNEYPLVLSIKEGGDVHLKLGSQLETLLNGPTFRDGFLRGRFAGDVDHEDARGRPYLLQLELKRRDDVLNGPVILTTRPDGRGTSAVSHWVELKREAAGGSNDAAASTGG
jgi:CubicO group peptidase (beta-lactamase class C family)